MDIASDDARTWRSLRSQIALHTRYGRADEAEALRAALRRERALLRVAELHAELGGGRGQ